MQAIFFFIRLEEHLQIKWFSFLNVIIKLYSRVVVPTCTLHQQCNCFPSTILRLIRLLHLARLRNAQTYHFGSCFPAAKWRKLTKQTSHHATGRVAWESAPLRSDYSDKGARAWLEMVWDGWTEGIIDKEYCNSFREVLLQIRAEVSPKIDLRKITVLGLVSKLGIFFY